jgi:hypothetical protein
MCNKRLANYEQILLSVKTRKQLFTIRENRSSLRAKEEQKATLNARRPLANHRLSAQKNGKRLACPLVGINKGNYMYIFNANTSSHSTSVDAFMLNHQSLSLTKSIGSDVDLAPLSASLGLGGLMLRDQHQVPVVRGIQSSKVLTPHHRY